jgi:GR25 family glycosyltransferase involved in LPS biosynthesis
MTIATYVITLDTESDRYRQFKDLNPHLAHEPFIGINGRELDEEDSIRRGFITRNCATSGLVSPGQLGCAISHWTLWWKAVYEEKSLLILEDDAATHPELQAWIDQADVCRDADMVLFAVNMDSVLQAISPEGIHIVSMFGEQWPSYASIGEKLALTRTIDVRPWRLVKGLGLCCYLVTPKGAAKLVEQLLPLRLDGVPLPLIVDMMPGIGVDRRLNALFDRVETYVTIPFLAWTPNSDSATRS